jgi:LysM repeat protein
MDQTVAQPATTEIIQADISGEINGQVAVGKYIVQIGSVHGGIVNINMAEQKPRLSARQAPVYVLPRRFARLLDRVNEVEGAAEALPAAQPVEFHAENGAGKSSVLRVLARHALTTAFPDGVVYLPARNQTAADLLQSIFDALFEYDAPYKPSEGEIRSALQNKRALIVLDDVDLSREDLESLFDAAPECGFLLASPDRKLWGVGLSVALPGLPVQEGRILLERELGRSLSEKESAAADALLSNLRGNPLAIIQAAALVRERDHSVESLAAATRDPKPEKKIAAALLGLLNKEERRVVASIAALNGAPLNARHLPALTQIPQVEPLLGQLEKRGLVQAAGSDRYTLAGSFSLFLRETWDLGEWRQGLLNYFRAWAEARLDEPQKILEDADAILRLIEWAADAGRWQGALDLVKAAEGALALERRWGAWEQALQWALEAAQALGNLNARAWALHQLGTRALALGEEAAARQALIQALRLREMLGDRAGAAVTRHNLNVLLGPPGGNGDSPPDAPLRPGASLYKVAAGTLTALVISGSILASVLRHDPVPVPMFTATVTMTTVVADPEGNIPDTGGNPTASSSPSPTASLVIPTDTPSPTTDISETPTDSATITGPPCVARQEWSVYTVRAGDTLWSIAQATGSSVLELRIANCLPGTRIDSGQPLLVPRLPVFTPTFTATLTPTFTPTFTPTLTPTFTPTFTPTHTPTHTETLTPSPTTPVPQFPDLVVSSLEVGYPYGALQVIDPSAFTLLLSVTVANVGQAEAGPFQVAVYHRGLDMDNQPQPASISLLFGVEGLVAGASLSHTEDLAFDAPASWRAIEVWAVVDDCTGLHLAGVCQVPESDENNNRSSTQTVVLWVNEPPKVEIIHPAVDETLIYDGFEGDMWFKALLLQGYAEDAEDGLLDGASLVWTTDQSALQPAELGAGAEIRTTLFSDRCAGTTHVVTLTATDSQGAFSQVQRRITLAPESCDPSLQVDSPASDVYFPSGYEKDYRRSYLVLDGQAWAYDALERPIGDRIVWETDQSDIQDAILGYGENVELWLYLPDNPDDRCDEITHTLQVTVSDNEGYQAGQAIPITISECPVIGLESNQE